MPTGSWLVLEEQTDQSKAQHSKGKSKKVPTPPSAETEQDLRFLRNPGKKEAIRIQMIAPWSYQEKSRIRQAKNVDGRYWNW